MKEAYLKLAKIIKTEPEIIEKIDKHMAELSGKEGVVESIVSDIESKVTQSLKELALEEPTAEQVFEALQQKLIADDQKLFAHFGQPDFSNSDDYSQVLNKIKDLAGPLKGYYLKPAKAKEFLKLNPPKNIMSVLGYDDVTEMVEKEDCLELYAALRIVEDSKWLNSTFFAPYQDLKGDDFEEREIKAMVLSEKWAEAGRQFSSKKLHHMSHLKEMGLVFVVPSSISGPGELIYLFFMTLHYLHEVDWHAKLFAQYRQDSDFAQKMIDALKVEVAEVEVEAGDKLNWRIIPTYLAKKDPDDPRLKYPRINPETYHYTKAAEDIKKFTQANPGLLDFWNDLNHVAGLFKDKAGQEKTISFDMFDNGISLLGQVGLESKYLYHQQEELWNRLFSAYLGEQKMNQLMMQNLHQGYVTI